MVYFYQLNLIRCRRSENPDSVYASDRPHELLTVPRTMISVAVCVKGDWSNFLVIPAGTLTRDMDTLQKSFSGQVDDHLKTHDPKDEAFIQFSHASRMSDVISMASSIGMKIPDLTIGQLAFTLNRLRLE